MTKGYIWSQVDARTRNCFVGEMFLGDDLISGAYYGSDGLRSPLTVGRDPGTPENQGEDESTIDPAKYSK